MTRRIVVPCRGAVVAVTAGALWLAGCAGIGNFLGKTAIGAGVGAAGGYIYDKAKDND